jgi:GNAT superfamily N-acetyltransferase
MSDYAIYTLAQRPDLKSQGDAVAQRGWFPFMLHHKITKPLWQRLFTDFAEYQFVVCEPGTEKVFAVSNNIPLHWGGTPESLPAGWDASFLQGFQDRAEGIAPTVVSAVSVAVDPIERRRGLGTLLLLEMKALAERHNLPLGLIATVRPTQKARYPLIPLEDYIHWQKPDGTPYDAWIETHLDIGGKMLGVIPRSKHISADVRLWEEWTGLIFPQDGQYIVPDTLAPVEVEGNKATYWEPNVWFHHPLF